MSEVRSVDTITFDTFVENHPHGSFYQTSRWAKMKEDHFKSEMFVVIDGGKIVGSCLMLVRKIVGMLTLAYVPRGFVCDYDDESVVSQLIEEAKKRAKKHHAIELVIEPCAMRDAYPNLPTLLTKHKFKHCGYDTVLSHFQPRIEMQIQLHDTIEEYFSSLKGKEKNRIKNGLAKGLQVIDGSRKDISIYSQINRMTEDRNAIKLRDQSYFEKLFDTFYPDNNLDFVLVKLDREAYKKDEEIRFFQAYKQIEEFTQKVEKYPENKRFVNSLQDAKATLQTLVNRQKEFNDCKEEYLAGAFVVYCGKEAMYLYAASSNALRFLDPSIVMNYTLIQRAIERGCTVYNMGGIHSLDKHDGLYMFKSQMLAKPYEYEGFFTLSIHPVLDALFQKALKIKEARSH